MHLTPQQAAFLDFLENYTEAHGYAPTQQEIAEHFGYKSLGTVQDYIHRLKQKGCLEHTSHGTRAVTVLPRNDRKSDVAPTKHHPATLPLLGRVAAGAPIEALLDQEQIEVPSLMTSKPGDYFALEVKGDSMIEDGILDGDHVVIRRQKDANNGDTVVALVDREATIKRFYQKPDHIELHPANSDYAPIHISESQEFHVEGLLVGLIRHLH